MLSYFQSIRVTVPRAEVDAGSGKSFRIPFFFFCVASAWLPKLLIWFISSFDFVTYP